MRFSALFTLVLLVLVRLLGWVTVAGAAPQRQPVDRILAVVDDDPILASEVRQVLSFGLVEPQKGEDDRELQRRALDFLIEVRLRFHEVDRFGFAEVPIDEVDEQMELLRQRFGSDEEFRRGLEELGLSEQGARQVLARQVMVWIYVEERLGARVFVDLEDIQNYYDEILVPQLIEQGNPVPPILEVREPIRALLHEQRMNEELERWTTELLQQADVEDFFDSNYDSLPPVLFSSEPATE
jgi:hypothetical protein